MKSLPLKNKKRHHPCSLGSHSLIGMIEISLMLEKMAQCYSSPGIRVINCLRMLSFEQSIVRRRKNFPENGDRGMKY